MQRRSDKNAKPRASTAQILGGPQPGRIAPKWAEHYNVLLDLRERLVGKAGSRNEIARDELPSFSEHMADAATDSYDRDWALASLTAEQMAIYEIDEALQRIRNGTYGRCQVTGDKIEAERLRAIPWTRFSAQAQAQLETRGMVHRPHLGALGTYAQTASEAETETDTEDEAAEPQREAA